MANFQAGSIRFYLTALAALSLFAAPASAEKTEMGKIQGAKVWFKDLPPVNVGAVTGKLGEGPYQGAESWIVEVRDDSGQVVDSVKRGGEIIMISPTVYAKRDRGDKTFVIARTDKARKPIKTNFVLILNHLTTAGGFSLSWSGPAGGAFGVTGLPARVPGQYGANIYRTATRGLLAAAGQVTGISDAGELTDTYNDAVAVQSYGDYNIVVFSGGAEHQIADQSLRALSPRTDKFHAFVPAYREQLGNTVDGYFDMGYDYPAVMYGVVAGVLGNGKPIYQLLPRRRGETYPPELIGFVPLNLYNSGSGCRHDFPGKNCTAAVTAFSAIWATPEGPEMALHNFDGTPVNDQRYASIAWWGAIPDSLERGIVVEKNGQAHLVTATLHRPGGQGWDRPGLTVGTQAYNGDAGARAEIARLGEVIRKRQTDEWLAYQKAQDEDARRAAANAEFWAELRQKKYTELQIAESRETRRAWALQDFGPDQWQVVCNEGAAMQTVYARSMALKRCHEIRPQPVETYTPRKRDFWGDLAQALDAWSSLSAQGGGAAYRSTVPPAGSSPDWNFERSMKSIDNTIRTVTDPNWNGSATRAGR